MLTAGRGIANSQRSFRYRQLHVSKINGRKKEKFKKQLLFLKQREKCGITELLTLEEVSHFHVANVIQVALFRHRTHLLFFIVLFLVSLL